MFWFIILVLFFGDTNYVYVGSSFYVFYNFSLLPINSLFPFHFCSLSSSLSFASCTHWVFHNIYLILHHFLFLLQSCDDFIFFLSTSFFSATPILLPLATSPILLLNFSIPTLKYFFHGEVLHWDLKCLNFMVKYLFIMFISSQETFLYRVLFCEYNLLFFSYNISIC